MGCARFVLAEAELCWQIIEHTILHWDSLFAIDEMSTIDISSISMVQDKIGIIAGQFEKSVQVLERVSQIRC